MISGLLKKTKIMPIGLDIGNHSVKMIQLAVCDNQIEVVAAEEMAIPADIKDSREKRRFIISAVQDMIETGGFTGKEAVTCLNDDRVNMTSVKLSGEQNTLDAIYNESQQRFGITPENGVVQYLEAGNVKSGEDVKREYIIFAADNETLQEHIELLESSCLTPCSIDIVPCALFRSFQAYLRRKADWQKTTVFVDLGSKYTTVVFGQEGGICFAKQIPIGGKDFSIEIAKKMDVSLSDAQMLRDKVNQIKNDSADTDDKYFIDASVRQSVVDAIGGISEKLVKEVSLCLRYYTVTFRGKRVERAFFTGGETYENILLNTFKRHMTIDIEIANPFRGIELGKVNLDPDRRKSMCEWSVAVGLGLKGAKLFSDN